MRFLILSHWLSGRPVLFALIYISHIDVNIIFCACCLCVQRHFGTFNESSLRLFFMRLLSLIQFLHRPFCYTFSISTGCATRLSDIQKRDRISFLLELKFKFGWLLWNFRRKKRVDFFAEICADFAYAVRIYKYLKEEEEEDKICSIPFHT